MTEAEMKARIKELETSVAALEVKRDELIAEAKSAKTKLKAAEERAKDLETEAETLRADLEKKAGGAEDLKRSLENKHAREKADLQGKLDASQAQIRRLVVENGLKDALTAAGVAPHFVKAAEAMLSGRATVEAEGDVPRAVIDGKPLAEFVKGWAASDDGKHFVPHQSAGGGAAGGKPPSGAPTKNPYSRKDGGWNMTEQARLERENPAEAKRLKEEARAAT